ncbi:MAG: hypothetical protein IJZ72_08000 [Oscillospiraceae bacterium]|nr:hypothetical protein [Oscillospiraceae bacterium]
MDNAVKASTGFVLSHSLWRVFTPVVWLMLMFGSLISFGNIVMGFEDGSGILVSMSAFSGIFCSVIFACSADDFVTNYPSIKVLPVRKTNALKACINKTMLFYIAPYALIIPIEFYLAKEHSIFCMLTSLCITVDLAAIAGSIYCLSFFMKMSKNKNTAAGAYALLYGCTYILYGLKGLFDKNIFLSQGNVVELISALVSAVISVLLFLKARDTVAEKFE